MGQLFRVGYVDYRRSDLCPHLFRHSVYHVRPVHLYHRTEPTN